MAGGSLRASDRDRDEVVEHLRRNCVDGRITLEELEERLEGVMTAATVADLSGFIADLPSIDRPGDRAPSAPAKAGPVGVLPFTHRVVVPASHGETREQVLSTLAPRLSDFGYELVTQSPTGLVFEYRSRPPWTILAAIVAFPVGLVALTVKRDERVVISLEPRSTGSTYMVVHGKAPRRVRKAFLGLTF